MKESKRGIGLGFALNGIKVAITHERNFRIHLLVTFFVLVVSFIYNLSSYEWAIICIGIFIVLITELFNSAIERLIDYLKPEIHPLAKIIKDISAAAVLLAALMSVILGLLVFIPKIL